MSTDKWNFHVRKGRRANLSTITHNQFRNEAIQIHYDSKEKVKDPHAWLIGLEIPTKAQLRKKYGANYETSLAQSLRR